MKTKSLLAMLFALPLIACNSSNASKLKEISREEAIERNSGVTVQFVIENCGQYVKYTWEATISHKTGVFAQYTDEEINQELTGEVVYGVQDEYSWLIATPEYITAGCTDTEEDTYSFYASGKQGLVVKCVSCWHEQYVAGETMYHVVTNLKSTTTFGKYGQIIKWYGEYDYTIDPEYYPEGDVSGGFKMKWTETFEYTDDRPDIL